MVTFTSKLGALLATICANSHLFFCEGEEESEMSEEATGIVTNMLENPSKKLLLLFQVAVLVRRLKS